MTEPSKVDNIFDNIPEDVNIILNSKNEILNFKIEKDQVNSLTELWYNNKLDEDDAIQLGIEYHVKSTRTKLIPFKKKIDGLQQFWKTIENENNEKIQKLKEKINNTPSKNISEIVNDNVRPMNRTDIIILASLILTSAILVLSEVYAMSILLKMNFLHIAEQPFISYFFGLLFAAASIGVKIWSLKLSENGIKKYNKITIVMLVVSIIAAAISLFSSQTITGQDKVDISQANPLNTDSGNPWEIILFISFVFLSFTILQIFVGFIIEKFKKHGISHEKKISDNQEYLLLISELDNKHQRARQIAALFSLIDETNEILQGKIEAIKSELELLVREVYLDYEKKTKREEDILAIIKNKYHKSEALMEEAKELKIAADVMMKNLTA